MYLLEKRSYPDLNPGGIGLDEREKGGETTHWAEYSKRAARVDLCWRNWSQGSLFEYHALLDYGKPS